MDYSHQTPTKERGTPKVTFNCAECGAERTRWLTQTLDSRTKKPHKRMFCSRVCQRLGFTEYVTKKDKRARAQELQRKRYAEDNAWREKRKSGVRMRAALPENQARIKAHSHARYIRYRDKMRADPEAYAEWRRRQKAVAKRYREKFRREHGTVRVITDAQRTYKREWARANSARQKARKELSTAPKKRAQSAV